MSADADLEMAAPATEWQGGPTGGQVVVLVHGLGASWGVFAPILPLLAEQVSVLAIDLPGFGARAPDARTAPGVAGYADWLERDLAGRGIVAPHVVGSSMGGAVALEMARRGTAASATAFAPIGFWRRGGRRWCQALLTVLRGVARVAAAPAERALRRPSGRAVLLRPLYGTPREVDPDAAVAGLRALAAAPSFALARDSFAAQREIVVPARVPAAIVWGARDAVLPARRQAARARALMPAAQHTLLPTAGHLPFSDDPTACVEAILRRLPGAISAAATTQPTETPAGATP